MKTKKAFLLLLTLSAFALAVFAQMDTSKSRTNRMNGKSSYTTTPKSHSTTGKNKSDTLKTHKSMQHKGYKAKRDSIK